MAKKKPRAPQDATMRNVRASRKRDAGLAARVRKLELSVGVLAASLGALAAVMGKK